MVAPILKVMNGFETLFLKSNNTKLQEFRAESNEASGSGLKLTFSATLSASTKSLSVLVLARTALGMSSKKVANRSWSSGVKGFLFLFREVWYQSGVTTASTPPSQLTEPLRRTKCCNDFKTKNIACHFPLVDSVANFFCGDIDRFRRIKDDDYD